MILDTDVLVDLARKHPAAMAWIASLTVPPRVSGIAAMELLFGSLNKTELREVRRLLVLFVRIWPSEAAMDKAADEYPELKLSSGLGPLDALIAVTAISLGEEVVTFNSKHFNSVPGLVTVQPYIR